MAGDRHYTYTMALFDGEYGAEAEKFVFAVAYGLLIFLLGFFAAKRLRQPSGIEKELIPKKRFSLFSFFDLYTEGFIKLHDFILGKANRRFFPLSASIFIFLFFGNILGLIPFMPAVTTTVWVNVGIALLVFLTFNYYGFKEHGVIGYLKHFAGGDNVLKGPIIIALLIAPVLFAIEIFSIVLRPLVLNLRLYWNITADHIIIGTFFDMLGGFFIVAGQILYAKGLLVSLIQAGVFTILTMVYILLATQHEEE